MRNQIKDKGERVIQFVLFLTLVFSYSYFFPRWADPNQNSRMDMVVAIVDDGTFQIDPYVKNTVDYAKVGDHYYSDKAPGVAFLGVPIYWGIKVVLDLPVMDKVTQKLLSNSAFQASLNPEGTGITLQKVRFAIAQVVISFLTSVIPVGILGVLLFRFLKRYTQNIWLRILLVLAYGLLTPAYAYSNTMMGHQLSAVLLFTAFYLSFRLERFSIVRLLGIGFLLGYSVITEYPSAMIAGFISLYLCYELFKQKKIANIVWVITSGGICVVGWMVYNTVVFGGPLKLGYSNSELWTTQHQTGFMSLTYPHWDAVWGITFSLFRGLFVLSPFLLLSIPGFILWYKRKVDRIEFWVVLLSVVSFYVFNSSSIMWWGGFAIGPRYLLPMLPFNVVPIVFVFITWGQKIWLKIVSVVLLGLSLLNTWGLTLAGQAFPSDTIKNPLVDYALSNWLGGNIARNLGTILGVKGISSFMLYGIVILGLLFIIYVLVKKYRLNSSLVAE